MIGGRRCSPWLLQGGVDGGGEFFVGGVEGAVETAAGGFGVAAAVELAADFVDVDVAFAAQTSADSAVGHFGEEGDDFDGGDDEGHVDEVFGLAGGGGGFGEVGFAEEHGGELVPGGAAGPAEAGEGALHEGEFGAGFVLHEAFVEGGGVDEGGEGGGHFVGARGDGVEAEPAGVADEAGEEGEGEGFGHGELGEGGELPEEFGAGGGGVVGVEELGWADGVAGEVVVDGEDFIVVGFEEGLGGFELGVGAGVDEEDGVEVVGG